MLFADVIELKGRDGDQQRHWNFDLVQRFSWKILLLIQIWKLKHLNAKRPGKL